MKSIPQIFILFLFSLLLNACAGLDQNRNESSECKKLRRQMAYNRHNPNVEAKWSTRSQQHRLQELYEENNCGKA